MVHQSGNELRRKRTALLVICLSALVTVLAVAAVVIRLVPGASKDFSGRLSLDLGDLASFSLSTNSDGTADFTFLQNGQEVGTFSGPFDCVGDADGSAEYLLTIRSLTSRGDSQSAAEIDEMNTSQGFIARLDGSVIRFVIPRQFPAGGIEGTWELDASQLTHYMMSSISPDSVLNQEGSASSMVLAMNALEDGSIDLSVKTSVEILSEGVKGETLTSAEGECRTIGEGEFQVLVSDVEVLTTGDSVLTTPLTNESLLEGASFSLRYDSLTD